MKLKRTVEWRDGVLLTIDQTLLPLEEKIIELHSCEEVAEAIKNMRVRGAPLIGVIAAYGLALTAYHSKTKDKNRLIKELEKSAEILKKTRPTAVNLFWAINRVLDKARNTDGDVKTVINAVIEEANTIMEEDYQANKRMGSYGASLIKDGDTILTHCNAGALATAGYGTALGVIRAAWESGKCIKVFATETRPKLQGARLTAYELMKEGIPVTLITDNMVAYVMSKNMVDLAIVGADRIVLDAVINKIGTYGIAVLAKEHKIPFYVAAPTSTFDLKRKSEDVIIEERDPSEVTYIRGVRIAPESVNVLNPAFDITPLRYVSAIITEKGVLKPPYEQSFKKIIGY